MIKSLIGILSTIIAAIIVFKFGFWIARVILGIVASLFSGVIGIMFTILGLAFSVAFPLFILYIVFMFLKKLLS